MSAVAEIDNLVANAEMIAADLMRKARIAQEGFADADQARVDEAVRAIAWSLYKPEHARELAELAVVDTGLGNVPDKIIKKQRKTFGTLRDLLRVKSVGEIERDDKRGIVKFAKPMGVIGAITPSTNPGATPVNKTMMAIKGRNAVIIAPSPLGYRTTALAVEYMRSALDAIGLPKDLVQILPNPVTKETTQAIMEAVDLVVVTGSQDNVRRAYRSGTPAIGVGAGNVPVIVDETADLTAAAQKICASKTFDNATSCSSENAVVIVSSVYDAAIEALKKAGGYLVDEAQKKRVQGELWKNGKLNRHLIARDMPVLADSFDLPAEAKSAKFLLVEETGIGKAYPLSGEKLALVLTVYRAPDFKAAAETIRKILDFQGKGHSMGLHTTNMARARELAEQLPVVRVLVNFAHTFGNGGGFDSGLEFTLTMGCGSWQKNSISENLNYKHFLNITHLVVPIAEDKPSEEELFGPHWKRYGR
ncbi:aldehyde dehydrogenase family protein [Bradyrhizobium sp. NP1]|uniref:acylating sulfoacetaldehyde dehydrogenase n=1 Tax=Bradyrhizobium sp. NP1 TaxID=3049772 RepID=UPI0025A59D27|nr:aldehyde dehydrogenase family protein [Bradyrhizobium sp. NP1]WJR75891.1 aldehyde dehydrogenase family protein [Bradyrhizobium sp. NP1]